MKNKYLRLKLVARKNQRAKEIDRREKAERAINRLTPGEYEWPRGSGRFYAGVLCQLNIKEVVSG